MSGGHFDYIQNKIEWDVVEELYDLIKLSGKKKTEDEIEEERKYSSYAPEYNEEDLYHTKYSANVIEKFKEAKKACEKASIYIRRVDWYLSGDDGEENFLKRLSEELKNLDNEQ